MDFAVSIVTFILGSVLVAVCLLAIPGVPREEAHGHDHGHGHGGH